MGDARYRQLFLAENVVLLSGTAYYFSNGVYGVWPLAWIAPIPVLLHAFSAPATRAFVAASLAYLLGSLSYVRASVGVPPQFLAVGLAIASLAFAVIILITRTVCQRSRHWLSVLVFPILCTAWDHLWAQMRLPHSQAAFLPLAQIVSVSGLAGITFLMTLLPSGIAVAWYLRAARGAATVALLLPVVVCMAVVAWGWRRIATAPSSNTVRVGLAATDTTVRFFRTENRDEALRVIEAYAARVGTLAGHGAQVVVLPEKLVGVTPSYADDARAVLAQAATTHQVHVVAGFNQIEQPASRNLAVVFDRSGAITMEYEKRLLVPGFEDHFRAGSASGVLADPPGWGVAVCRDLLFPELGREYSRAGVGLMLIPAWDFVVDQDLTAQITRLRAIEGGFAIARATQEGIVLLTDHLGRVVGQQASRDVPEVLLLDDVTLGPGRTLYAENGDYFARAMVAAAVIMLGLVFVPTRGSTASHLPRTR